MAWALNTGRQKRRSPRARRSPARVHSARYASYCLARETTWRSSAPGLVLAGACNRRRALEFERRHRCPGCDSGPVLLLRHDYGPHAAIAALRRRVLGRLHAEKFGLRVVGNVAAAHVVT